MFSRERMHWVNFFINMLWQSNSQECIVFCLTRSGPIFQNGASLSHLVITNLSEQELHLGFLKATFWDHFSLMPIRYPLPKLLSTTLSLTISVQMTHLYNYVSPYDRSHFQSLNQFSHCSHEHIWVMFLYLNAERDISVYLFPKM